MSGLEDGPGAIFEEEVSSYWIPSILGVVALLFLALEVQRSTMTPIAPPAGLFPAMSLLFLTLALTFRRLTIRITSEGVRVTYTLFRYDVAWDDIVDVAVDDTSAFWYRGYGIRLARGRDGWVLVFSTIGPARVTLVLKGRWFSYFVFSTRRPDEVVKLVQERMHEGSK